MIKFERDKVYKTRDGQEARVICVDAGGGQPIVAILGPGVLRFCPDGSWAAPGTPCACDLMPPKPEPIVEWGMQGEFFHAAESKEAAKATMEAAHLRGEKHPFRLAKRVTTFEDAQ